MRTVKRDLLVLGTLLLLGALSLTGCAPEPTPRASETTAPTDAPVFASDEEALAAATEAFAAYQAMSSQIAQEGGIDPERMREYAIGAALEAEIESLNGLAAGGLRGVGALGFDSATLQEADLGTGRIETYLCLDVSGADVVNGEGVSTVPADRTLRLPLQVGFTLVSDSDHLLVETSESWSGTNFC